MGRLTAALVVRRATIVGRRHGIHGKNLDDIGNALQGEAPEGAERDFAQVAHGAPDAVGDHDRARLRQGLDARRHIDAMSVDHVLPSGDLPDIGRDAELDRLAVLPPGLLPELRLHLDGEADRLLGALEQGQDAVPRDLDDASPVGADQRLEEVDRPGCAVRILQLVLLDPPAVADHVGHQDGGQLAPAIL